MTSNWLCFGHRSCHRNHPKSQNRKAYEGQSTARHQGQRQPEAEDVGSETGQDRAARRSQSHYGLSHAKETSRAEASSLARLDRSYPLGVNLFQRASSAVAGALSLCCSSAVVPLPCFPLSSGQSVRIPSASGPGRRRYPLWGLESMGVVVGAGRQASGERGGQGCGWSLQKCAMCLK